MITFVKPLALAHITSGWADDRSYRGGVHEGLDFRAPIGTPVFAAGDGVVSQVTTSTGAAGLFIVIKHVGGLFSRYMHLSKAFVKPGATVSRGQVIANSGASGIQNSAAHLHFDIRATKEGVANYLRSFGQPGPAGFPDKGNGQFAIPAEPIVPADTYKETVTERAARHGIPLYGKTAIIGGGIAGLLIVGGGIWLLWKALS